MFETSKDRISLNELNYTGVEVYKLLKSLQVKSPKCAAEHHFGVSDNDLSSRGAALQIVSSAISALDEALRYYIFSLLLMVREHKAC